MENFDKISLSQALLAPLDALLKAQVHAARSFLNLVSQIGFARRTDAPDELALVEFPITTGGETHVAKVPVLALVPLQPLAITHAEYDITLQVSEISAHTQIKAADREKSPGDDPHRRPWMLVDNPVSVRGRLDGSDQQTRSSEIKVHVTVERIAVPTALSRVLRSYAGNVHPEPVVTTDDDTAEI